MAERHRHAFSLTRPEYSYCPICRRIPTEFTAVVTASASRAARLRALLPDVMVLYWKAKTWQQEREAYSLARALGMPASYGEAA